ncbi:MULTISPECIES: glycosyltransferase [Acinetobacter]|uniref:glycosyltransferase n=1 Tax=Acinetobacter TaxID=469 RepID=UPI00257E2C57|nr:glycosyltransferase [Acinetobacter sp. UBA5984]
MKYIIDNSNLYAGGGIQVASSFLNDLKNLNLKNEYHVIQSFKMAESFDINDFPVNFKFYNLCRESEKSIVIRIKKVKLIENKIIPDCIFTIFGPSYHKSKFPKIVGFAIPHIIYGDSPYIKNLDLLSKIKNKLIMEFKRFFFVKNSDALVFETNDACKRFEKLSGFENNYVVGNTLNQIFLDQSKWKSFDLNDNNKLKVLMVTANYPHKNIMLIPSIIDKLIVEKGFNNFKFIITLDKKELGFSSVYDDYIQYVGKVSLSHLPSLYEQSTIVFIPTLLEVFSATYLEAMYMSKAIVASDMGFSRDICDDAAYYCNPLDTNQYVDGIFNLLSNSHLRESLEKKGRARVEEFGSSMERSLKYLEIIENINSK